MSVTRIGDGVYRVEINGRGEIVYIAGSRDDRWAFWDGHVFRGPSGEEEAAAPRTARHDLHQKLSAPMPATVIKVLVTAGVPVKRGQPLVILEAMKMELPLRASRDATVKTVNCREGELVQPDRVLVELA